jgi:GntR family transcriptional regulator
MRYLDVAEQLRVRLAEGEVGAGGALPSEAELGEQFGASRVTVRRALEALRSEGLVTSRRGSGWFVAADPVRQALGRVTTVEAALEAAGARPERRVLEFAFEAATAEVAKALEVPRDADVLRVKRLNLADGEPFALVTVWLPGHLGAEISRAEVEVATFYDLLPLRGVALGRAVQQIGADLATADDARHLQVAKGAPVLTARRITSDIEHHAVLFSLHRYPAERTSVEIELPSLAFESTREKRTSHAKG